jgi:hypothetical protein
MARELLALEKGLRFYKENSDSEFLDLLFGAGVPGGDAGEQDAAAIGSAYFRENGTFYQKIASTNATSDWLLNGNGSSSVIPVFNRSIVVRAGTGEALTAGVRNLTTTPFTDDNAPLMVATDFLVNDYVIGGIGGTPVLYQVTNVTTPNITLALASPVMASNEGFIIQNYLPNSPGSMENQALVMYNGAAIIKLADINWDFATGIKLSGAYTSVAGTITSADTVESAIAKLDQGEKDLVSLSGVAANSVNLGAFTGGIISPTDTIKQALQQLETYAVSNGQVSAGAITTLVTVDSVLVDVVAAVKWYIRIWEDATPANVQAFELFAMHNGSAAADASVSKDQEYAVMKSGAAFNHVVSVDLNGSGVAQVIRLRMSSSSGGISAKVYREVVKF